MFIIHAVFVIPALHLSSRACEGSHELTYTFRGKGKAVVSLHTGFLLIAYCQNVRSFAYAQDDKNAICHPRLVPRTSRGRIHPRIHGAKNYTVSTRFKLDPATSAG